MPDADHERTKTRALPMAGVLTSMLVVLAGCSSGPGASSAPAGQAWVASYSYDSQPGDTVTPVDLASMHAQAPVRTASLPAGLASTPDGAQLLVANRGLDTLSVVDTGSHQVIGTVGVGLEPVAVAIASVPGRPPLAIVANFGDDTVTPVNLTTRHAGRPVNVGHQPDAVAIAPGGTSGAGIALVADFASNQVTAVDLGTMRPRGNIPVGTEPNAIVVAPGGIGGAGIALVTNFGSDNLTPISLAFGFPGPPIALPVNPTDIALGPRGSTVWVSGGSGVVSLSVGGRTVGEPVRVRGVAEGLAVSSDGTTAWVTTQNGQLVPVDLRARTAGHGIAVGGRPTAVVITK